MLGEKLALFLRFVARLEIETRHSVGDDVLVTGDEDQFGAILFY